MAQLITADFVTVDFSLRKKGYKPFVPKGMGADRQQ
jgi:hypothetical protein